jgi:hypothetical protein
MPKKRPVSSASKAPKRQTAPTPTKATRTQPQALPQKSSAPRTDPTTNKLPHDRIAWEAHTIWKEKGRPQGKDMDNWLEAEARLRNRTKS